MFVFIFRHVCKTWRKSFAKRQKNTGNFLILKIKDIAILAAKFQLFLKKSVVHTKDTQIIEVGTGTSCGQTENTEFEKNSVRTLNLYSLYLHLKFM